MTPASYSDNSLQLDVRQISAELRIRPEIYLKIVTNFALSLSGKMKILSEAITSDQRDQLRMTLHEIRGTAGNLRLRDISAAEVVIHDAAKAGANAILLMQFFQKLEEEVVRLQKCVEKLNRQQ